MALETFLVDDWLQQEFHEALRFIAARWSMDSLPQRNMRMNQSI